MSSFSRKFFALSLLTLLVSSVASAAAPLLVASFGNQVRSSALAISRDGNVVRSETYQGQTQTVNENPLSGAELSLLKSRIEYAKKARIIKTAVSLPLGGSSGTIATYVGAKKIELDGIVRKDLYTATKLKSTSASLQKIKIFVNRYVQVKLP